jgi:lysophospholipid hydrolase
VIEGFLDILLPLKKSPQDQQPIPRSTPTPDTPPSEFWRNAQGLKDKKLEQKLLFTVKPGGIAGYLCQLRNLFEDGID